MKILVNASTLSSTGVVQVASSFINECKKFDNQYFIILNDFFYNQIDINTFPNNFTFLFVKSSPNKPILGYKIRKLLTSESKKWDPDCVFSIFGPSYWTPNKPHLMGYAYPHYVYPESPFFLNQNVFLKLKINLYKHLHKYLLKKNGKFYVSETQDVSERAIKYLGCEKDQMFTVSNTYNHFFSNFINSKSNLLLPQKKEKEFRFLCLCSLAPHKNLEILNKVIPLMHQYTCKQEFKFILTIGTDELKKNFSLEAQKSIINIGRIEVSKCPQLYSETDALFLPSLLECFTANYPEAMIMQKPIITSNLPFASTICKNAALYFDPLDPLDIANKLTQIMTDQKLRRDLVKKGSQIVKTTPSSEDRAIQYLDILKNISRKN